MRAILITLISIYAISLQTQAQTTSIEHYKSVYHMAVTNGDLDVAANAIYHIQALKPKAGNWNDTLARVYFSSQKYGLAKNVAEDILQDEPDNIPIRTVAAYSNKQLGRVKESIPHFEKLYAGTQNLNHLYELITSQFSLRRYGECAANINKLLEKEDAKKQMTRVQVNRQETQEVSLYAAGMNIKGVISMEMGNIEHARKFFNQALAQSPDFKLPQQNLQTIKEQEAENQKQKGNKK